MLTLERVNLRVKKVRADVELIQGMGYFYFFSVKDEGFNSFSHPIPVSDVSHYTIEQWIFMLYNILEDMK